MTSYTTFGEKLLRWFEVNKRRFPWRETQDPFRILIAEILLRKTDAPKVERVYERFVSRYPDAQTLANTSVAELEMELKPLGLQRRRAEELKSLAEMLMRKYGGKIPCVKEQLMELPGVGDYIANAFLCFACSTDMPLLDTNFIRVLRRVFGLMSSKSRARTDKKLWAIVDQMIPRGKAREFNLALLDFAALICTSKNPRCPNCPMGGVCLAFKGKVPF